MGRAPVAGVGVMCLWRLTLLGAVLTVTLWLAVDLETGLRWWASLLSLVPPQVLAPLSLTLLALALRRRAWGLAGANTALLMLVLWAAGFNLPAEGTSTGGVRLRVVSFNVDRGAAGAGRIAAVLKPLGTDVLALQENLGEHNDHFQQALTAAFPGWHAVRYDELLMLSRFPIVSAGPVRFPHSSHALLRAVLAVDGRRLTLLDVHLETIGAVASASDIRLGRGLVERLKRRDAVRRDGTVLLTGLARQTSGPLLVAGDFNLSPRGPLYRQLSGTFSNAFAARGWGFGFTHAARLPWGRIDHLWLHGAVRAESAWAAAVVASDHRPLVADVRLR